jgi:protein MpaA
MSGVFASGPHALSEPEARIAYRLIQRVRPHVSIWFHQHLDLIWASGGDRAIERRFARLAGLPYRPRAPLAGSAISWQNHALPGTTAFAAELPAGEAPPAAAVRYARAMVALMRWARSSPRALGESGRNGSERAADPPRIEGRPMARPR